MNISEIEVGGKYTYFPPPETQTDRRHFPAVVEKVSKKRVRVRIFMEGHESGVIKSVGPNRLALQGNLF